MRINSGDEPLNDLTINIAWSLWQMVKPGGIKSRLPLMGIDVSLLICYFMFIKEMLLFKSGRVLKGA